MINRTSYLFVITSDPVVIDKLNEAGINSCCSNDNGQEYYPNSEEVLSLLTSAQKQRLIYTNRLMG